MNSPRILFIHGLESRANGSKTQILRGQGFDVRAHDMHMGVLQLSRQNSAIRMSLRLRETQFILGAMALTLAAGLKTPIKSLLATATLASGWFMLRKRAVLGQALQKSFEACVEIQRQAILREEPDIVVGSSWGGAVAVELMRTGAWMGPSVLLAPAVHRVCVKTQQGTGQDIARQLHGRSAKTIIFHDPSDDTVPYRDSEELALNAQMELRAVDAGGHRLLGLLTSGKLAEALQQLADSR
jgi:predicted esterase YcpF (UPF0227 family)